MLIYSLEKHILYNKILLCTCEKSTNLSFSQDAR